MGKKSRPVPGSNLTDALAAALRAVSHSAVPAEEGDNLSEQRTLVDPVVQRALALLLMREALAALERSNDKATVSHLQRAIETLVSRRQVNPPSNIP